MRRKICILVLLLSIIGAFFVSPVVGKEYPARPIELIHPYTPGGPLDLLGRLIAGLSLRYLGQPVIVTGKPGATGGVAAADIVNSPADGHKLLLIPNTFFALVTKTQKLPFDLNDLIPLMTVMEFKVGMIVKGDSQWKTLNDLLSHAKRNPGKLRWSHVGRGTSIFMSTYSIFRKAGIETIEVPYKGSAEQMAAVLGGHLDAAAITYGAVKDHVKTGAVKYLVVYRDKRFSDLPGVPTAVELGYPEAAMMPTYIALCAHKNTSEEIKKKLVSTFKKLYDDPEFKSGFEKIGEEPRLEGPEFYRDSVKKCEEIGVPMLKEFNLYLGK
jgi:tripartite-type tricarboxylate transporter receptor subunit TctC